jgi:hypothetical protein
LSVHPAIAVYTGAAEFQATPHRDREVSVEGDRLGKSFDDFVCLVRVDDRLDALPL